MTDRERLRRIRRMLVRHLGELERERTDLVRQGHPVRARQVLRAFQELGRVLESVDEILAA